MSLEDKVEAVRKISEALKKDPVEAPVERAPANKEHFDALMKAEQEKQTRTQKIDDTALAVNTDTQKPKSSLMDEVKKLNTRVQNLEHLTPENLKNQSRDLIAQIDILKTQLSQAQEIKPSYQKILHNRLMHVDDNLRIALSKAGVEYVAPQATEGSVHPVQRFLGYLTQGQYQLEHLEDTITKLGPTGELSPASMLVIQMKVGLIQQEIELCTTCLNKALESIKTTMNVQV